jgi:hypothetical protein
VKRPLRMRPRTSGALATWDEASKPPDSVSRPAQIWRCASRAEWLIATCVAPASNRTAIINELIALFDGPAQHKVQKLAAEALGCW